tara:strand:+ start:127 stop:789 length:663 start_codon:yes stop_codon:yes gene_type:complete
MLSFLTNTILLNSLSIPHPPFDPFYPPHPDVCSLSDKHNCLTSYYCGWCENTSFPFNDDDDDFFNNSTYPHPVHNSNGTCIDIGYCGIGILYGKNCNYVAMSNGCFLVKVCMLAVVFIVCINLVYCVIKGIHAPLLKSNFSTRCKSITVTLLYLLMFVPLMIFYFINFTVFVYILSCSAILGIIFWCMYGGNAAIHIMNNRNVPEDNDRNSEIAPLMVNN